MENKPFLTKSNTKIFPKTYLQTRNFMLLCSNTQEMNNGG